MLRRCSQRLAGRLLRRDNESNVTYWLQSRGLKETTGIVGLPVDPEARSNLRKKIHDVLEAIKGVPEDAYYRHNIQAIMQSKLKVVDSDATDEQVEEQLESQLESLVEQVDCELKLIPKMIEWQPWDVPDGHTIPIEIEEDVPPPEPAAAAPPPPPPPKK